MIEKWSAAERRDGDMVLSQKKNPERHCRRSSKKRRLKEKDRDHSQRKGSPPLPKGRRTLVDQFPDLERESANLRRDSGANNFG